MSNAYTQCQHCGKDTEVWWPDDWRAEREHLLSKLEMYEKALPDEKMVPIRFLHAMERLRPLCPDHADKQRGKECLACQIESLERTVERLNQTIAELKGEAGG
jgi:hypothetical protein